MVSSELYNVQGATSCHAVPRWARASTLFQRLSFATLRLLFQRNRLYAVSERLGSRLCGGLLKGLLPPVNPNTLPHATPGAPGMRNLLHRHRPFFIELLFTLDRHWMFSLLRCSDNSVVQWSLRHASQAFATVDPCTITVSPWVSASR